MVDELKSKSMILFKKNYPPPPHRGEGRERRGGEEGGGRRGGKRREGGGKRERESCLSLWSEVMDGDVGWVAGGRLCQEA